MFSDLLSFDITDNQINNIQNHTKHPINKLTTPIERNSHLYTQYESKLFIFGGGSKSELLDDCFVFDLEKQNWTKLNLQKICESMKFEMGGISYTNNKLILLGGRFYDDISDCLLIYDIPDVISEEEIKGKCLKLPMKICSFAYTTIYNHKSNFFKENPVMVIYGGTNGIEFFSNIILLDLVTFKWYYYKKSQELNIVGNICPMISHDNTNLVIFGGSNIQLETNQTTVIAIKDLLEGDNLKQYN